MSIPAINWAIEQKELPPAQWVLLFHLAHCHNQENGCYPSQDHLAEITNMAKRTIVRHASALEDGGYIKRVKRFNGRGDRISDLYILGCDASFNQHDASPSDNLASGEMGAANSPSANLTSGQSVHDFDQNLHETRTNCRPNMEKQEKQEVPPVSPPVASCEIRKLLERWASPDAVASFIAYRKRHKAKGLTLTAAKRLANSLSEIFNAGHDPTDALGLAEERGWASVNLDWYENSKGRRNDNRNRDTGSQQYGARGYGSGTVDAFAEVASRRAKANA